MYKQQRYRPQSIISMATVMTFQTQVLEKPMIRLHRKMMILLINISGVLVTGTTSRMSVEKYVIALNWA